MINSSPPREKLRERAPRLKWIQTTGAGVDQLSPFDWLPEDIALTNNSGAHGAKAEDSCGMALLMLNAGLPEVLTNQRERRWAVRFLDTDRRQKSRCDRLRRSRTGRGTRRQEIGYGAHRGDAQRQTHASCGRHVSGFSRIDRRWPKLISLS